jgi:hypothetical protein
MPSRHRTTARSLIALLALWVSVGTAGAAAPRLDFPVVGHYTHVKDFGAPRGHGPHEGNDIMAARRTPVLAVERGWVEKPSWSTSDCALVLEGASGRVYRYLHLNNDLTMSNDNDGGCVNGVAFAPHLPKQKDVAMWVRAGELIGYVGNSGNADATNPHLHFEIRPGGGSAIDPARALQDARRVVFPVPTYASSFTATFDGYFKWGQDGKLAIRVTRYRVHGTGWTAIPSRGVRLLYADDITVRRRSGAQATVGQAKEGERVRLWTGFLAEPRKAQLAYRDVMVASKLELRGS